MAMSDVEAILAQMTFAFGAGAGPIAYVERAALEALRERWRPNVEKYLGEWEQPGVASMVLTKFQMMGKLALEQAHAHGRVAISAADVGRAVETAMLGPTQYC